MNFACHHCLGLCCSCWVLGSLCPDPYQSICRTHLKPRQMMSTLAPWITSQILSKPAAIASCSSAAPSAHMASTFSVMILYILVYAVLGSQRLVKQRVEARLIIVNTSKTWWKCWLASKLNWPLLGQWPNASDNPRVTSKGCRWLGNKNVKTVSNDCHMALAFDNWWNTKAESHN